MRYSENVNSAFLYMQIQTQMENSSIGQLTEWFFPMHFYFKIYI